MSLTVVLVLLFLIAVAAIFYLFSRIRKFGAEHESLSAELSSLKERFSSVVDAEAERARVLADLEDQKRRLGEEMKTSKERADKELSETRQRELAAIETDRARLLAEIASARAEQQRALQGFQDERRRGEAEMFNLELSLSKLREEFKALDEEANLQSFGFYKPRYDFASSERYQAELERIRGRQKQMIQGKVAAVCQVEWTVNGNRAEGRKQINHTLKLILRAFNGESDAAIAKVRYNNVHVMEARIRKAFESINGLVGVQQCQIVTQYRDLKLEELFLAHEYQEKLQEEKEEQRRIREQMREEEIAQRELLKAQTDAEREEQRYAEALRKASEEAERAVGARQEKLLGQIDELQRLLSEAHTNKERAIARAQMTRSGHVYIISNVGSFGEQVYKIGMTRRLDPMDRVRELGDASVPFHFDVHAIIFSEDAPGLENKLHRAFHHRRVNMVNERKEFFRVSIEEIAEVVRSHDAEIEIVRDAEAIEYRKTLAMIGPAQPSATDVLSLPPADASVPA